MILATLIMPLLLQVTPAPTPVVTPNPTIELLKKQLQICEKYTANDEGMKQLIVDLTNAKDVADSVKWDTFKICIAYREGRLVQHDLDTRI
jgi:hypothetical protein